MYFSFSFFFQNITREKLFKKMIIIDINNNDDDDDDDYN